MSVQIKMIRHAWPEPAGFELIRKQGSPEYILIHFHTMSLFSVGDRQYTAQPGSFVIYAPYTPQRLTAPVPLVHDWIHLTGDVEPVLQEFGLECNKVYELPFSSTVSYLIELLEQAKYNHLPYFEEMTQSLFRAIVIHAAQQPDLTLFSNNSVIHERFCSLQHEITRYPERDWRVAVMAQKTGFSPSRFYTVFRSLMGTTPNAYVIERRIEAAKIYLTQGHSVAETAEMCGYSNVFHFIRQFRQKTGFTPGEYK